MSLHADAHGILADAELKLRELIRQALTAQQYTDLAHIARIADGVARLQRDDPAYLEQVTGEQSRQGSGQPSQGGVGITQRFGSPSPRGSRQKTAKFPQFERDGDKLIKIGWSKRDKRIYEHRAPYEVVVLLGAAISRRGKRNEPFTMDQILPLRKKDGSETPSYQTYLVLAWLRSLDIVERQGDGGYALADVSIDNEMLTRLWDSIPERK